MWYYRRIPPQPMPTVDVDQHPLVSVNINEQWANALLSLVQHADRAETWAEGTDIDLIEQNAYALYRVIRSAHGMIGSVIAYATTNEPENTLKCDGSTHARADYPVLYDRLPVGLIVDADNFMTPDLRGIFVLGASAAHPAFSIGGDEEVTLTTAQMPTHSHSTAPHFHSTVPHSHTYNQPTFGIDIESVGVPDPTGVGNPPIPMITSIEGVTVNAETVTVNDTGGDQPHPNMPPFIAMNYAIVAR